MKIETSIKKCFEYCFSNTDYSIESSVFENYAKSIPEDFVYHYPKDVIWKLTSACNLRCKHCFYYTKPEYFEAQSDLNKEEALELAHFFAEELNIMTVVLTGGEVFLSPYFYDIVKYLKSKNICITILTNGTLINKNCAQQLVDLLNPKYDSIQISLDGASEDIHDFIRGKGTFNKSIRAIEILSKLDFRPILATTITSENIKSLSDFSDIVKKYNIKQLRFSRYKVFSAEQEFLVPKLEDLFINIAKLIDKKVPITKNIFNAYDFLKFEQGKLLLEKLDKPSLFKVDRNCHNHNKMFVSATGKIYLCTSAETAGLCLGDLRKDNFYDIWDKRTQNPLFKPRKNYICTKCKYKYWCNSGCPVIAYLNNGSILSASPDCEHQQEKEILNV